MERKLIKVTSVSDWYKLVAIRNYKVVAAPDVFAVLAVDCRGEPVGALISTYRGRTNRVSGWVA